MAALFSGPGERKYSGKAGPGTEVVLWRHHNDVIL